MTMPHFHSSTTERFPPVTKHKLVKFGVHSKRRSGFPKEYSLTRFKKLWPSFPDAQQYQHGNIA